MTATYTFESYLTKRANEGIVIQRTEKFLQDDLNKFVGGRVTRSDIQILRRGLVKVGGVKQLLGSNGQRDILSKIRTCDFNQRLPKVDQRLHALNGKSKANNVKRKVQCSTAPFIPVSD